MGETATLRREDSAGLIIAIALHAAVVVLLLLQPVRDTILEMPESMTVSLATEVSLESTAPEPVAESSAAIAPTLSDVPAPALDGPAVTADLPSEPTSATTPARLNPSTAPAARTPPPATRRTSNPRQTPPAPNRDRSRPDREPTARATPNRERNTPQGGGSRIGEDFLGGNGRSTTTQETRPPASQIGPSARASIAQAISRQLKPHWKGKAPGGADAEKLVTILAWRLNEDGSLKGRPRVVRQLGITPSNEAQKARHAEVAIRAVQLAAPFDLPDEYYNAWKSIDGARFDRNLSR